jgi:hypothetical protein
MSETLELVVIDPKLEEQVQLSKIELPKAQQHALAFAPFMSKAIELGKALQSMDKENPSDTDAKVARINRLAMVKNRTSCDEIKAERKAGLLVETKLLDSLYGVVKSTSELAEAEYMAIEKHAENKEKERKDKLKQERLAELSPYMDASLYPLVEMEQSAYDQLLEGTKLQYQAKADKERKEREQQELDAKELELHWKRKALVGFGTTSQKTTRRTILVNYPKRTGSY